MKGIPAIRVAKLAVEHFVSYGQNPDISNLLTDPMRQQLACYVSIFENPGKRLRAMYGHPLPSQPTLGHEIMHNTIQAISAQMQSTTIRRGELSSFVYSIAVLGPLERIISEEHLDPKQYGLYLLSDHGKSTVLLPQRTGIETPQEQISTAYREANINPSHESVTLYRFSVSHFD